MATLKREVKKLPSESNLRLLSSLIVSIANKQSSLEDKCIAPWKADETYQKDISYVSHNGYVYICSVTNQDSVFTETHWSKLSDEFTELDVDTIKSYLNLTQDQLDTLASIISTEVRLDKCFSSSDTYKRIQDAIKESKEYCLKQLASKSTGSFKKANDVSEVTDGNYLYLIFNNGTSKYDIYALVDSNVELLTSVDVNLDNYYTKTEIDNDFLKKTDAASTYATITTVDSKVDQTDFDNHTADTVAHMTQDEKDSYALKNNVLAVDKVQTTTGSETNDSVYSSKLTKDELDKKVNETDIVDNLTSTDTDKPLSANQGKVLEDNKLDKTSIVTTIDSSSTNTQVPSAKATFDITKHNTIGFVCPDDKSPLEFALENTTRNEIIYFRSWENTTSDKGVRFSTYIAIKHHDPRYLTLIAISSIYRQYKINHYQINEWTGWQEMCSTSIANVGTTTITPVNSAITGTIEYTVKNGICYVSLFNVQSTTTDNGLSISATMPKPAINSSSAIAKNLGNGNIGFVYINKNTTQLTANFSIAGLLGGCSFSYPVAES